jgi:hypothetical protein
VSLGVPKFFTYRSIGSGTRGNLDSFLYMQTWCLGMKRQVNVLSLSTVEG